MSSVPFSRLQSEMESFYVEPLRSHRSRQKLTYVCKLLKRLGVKSTADLTTALVAQFVLARSRRVCANTIRGELCYVKAICNFAIESGYLDRLPVFRRARPRASRKQRNRLFTVDEVRRLLNHLEEQATDFKGHRLYALVTLIAYTGLRLREALWLEVAHVKLDQGVLWVLSRDENRLKTEESEAAVPIPPDLADVLRAWIREANSPWLFPNQTKTGPWVSGAYGTRPTELAKAAAAELGIHGLTLHSLRHTFATWARRRWGLSGLDLRDVLRHTTEHTQEHYVHQDPEIQSLVGKVRRVSYFRDAG